MAERRVMIVECGSPEDPWPNDTKHLGWGVATISSGRFIRGSHCGLGNVVREYEGLLEHVTCLECAARYAAEALKRDGGLEGSGGGGTSGGVFVVEYE